MPAALTPTLAEIAALAAADPAAVDVTAIARIVGSSSRNELRHQLVGQTREIVVAEIFRRFPDYMNAERTAGLRADVQWRIKGGADGQDDHWLCVIDGDHCRVERDGKAAVRPRATIRCDATEFLALVTGNANPAVSFVRRRIGVSGDIAFAASLTSLFRIPTADG